MFIFYITRTLENGNSSCGIGFYQVSYLHTFPNVFLFHVVAGMGIPYYIVLVSVPNNIEIY